MKHEDNFPTNRDGDRPANLVALAQMQARVRPNSLAYVFLDDGEREGARLTFGALDRRARTIAAHLQRHATPGTRALLLYPPSLDYIEAYFGCLYAGVIAVPAYPPSGRHLRRLNSILSDAEPSVIMTTQTLCERLSQERTIGPELNWCATDALDSNGAENWRQLHVAPDDIAFLQYTSGSTGDPRGVMVSHGNLIANESLIRESFHHNETSTLVGWLPLYHDMGLIGNILQPLYVGATAYLMSPMAFLEKPLRWLAAISNYQAQTSGGPNFGFDLCVRRITAEEKKSLDLTSWRIAFSGAEPVRAATLTRFSEAFGECGFRKQSFYPCYGLAEATLVVSAPLGPRETPVRVLERKALEQHKAITTEGSGVDTVGCGLAWPEHDIRIVAPSARTACADCEIGEIWVAGPSVAKGYWRREAQTKEVFRAQIENEDSKLYLRTGDLGFLDRGELYVTGRLKDLIIVGVRNYYPHDIEASVEDAVEGLRPGGTTAVHMTDRDEEAYIVFAEPRRSDLAALRASGGRPLIQMIRAALADAVDVAPRDIVLLKPGSTPKTSSGKLRRAECRRAYLSGEFDVLARASGAAETPATPAQFVDNSANPILMLALAQLTPDQRAPIVTRFLVTEAARLLRVADSEIEANVPVSQSGLDSLKVIELRHAIEQTLGVAPPVELLFSDATFAEVGRVISSFDPERREVTLNVDRRLSFNQQAMWTAQQLDAESIIYNLHLVLDVGAIDAQKLAKALRDTVAAHDQLRTVYRKTDEGAEALEKASDELSAPFDIIDASGWDRAKLQADFGLRAAQPFDLETQSPVRVALYHHDKGDALLFVAHHIAVDFWSLLLFITDLDMRYRGVGKVTPSARYDAFAARRRQYLETARSEEDWRYWRECLSGEMPPLQLPRDFNPRGAPSFAGAAKTLRLNCDETVALQSLAKRESVSLYSLLLTAYFILLQRHTGQRDIVVGAPTSGRLDAELAHTIGNFVNPVAIRVDIAAGLTTREALKLVNEKVRAALAHQEFPFPLVVERLNPQRAEGNWPIYQTTFVLQKAQSDLSDSLAALALGENGGPFDLFGGKAYAVGQYERVENFDIKLAAAIDAEGLLFSFQYRTQCFSDATIENMARHYGHLLQSLAKNIDRRIDTLPLMKPRASAAANAAWNETARVGAVPLTIARQFEAQAKQSPDAEALIFEDRRLSYVELNRRANKLAHYLRKQGVGDEAIVGLCLERGPALLIAMIGVMKTGAAYLPIDPDMPAGRVRIMIEDARPALIVSQMATASLLPSDVRIVMLDGDDADALALEDEQDIAIALRTANLAYVLFTSGSTGRPKAVAVEHGALSNCVTHFVSRLMMKPADRWLAVTTISFDIAALELFAPLTCGAAIVLSDPAQRLDPAYLSNTIMEHNVTLMQATPSLWSALFDSGWPGSKRLTALVGGERVSEALARRLGASCGLALNAYGPTETTIWSSDGEMRGRGGDLGHPIANTQIHVLSAGLEQAPEGVVGEAFIGGQGLARGYLGRPDLTAERFVPDPHGLPGARLYRTGDLVRRRLDGSLDYLGRLDEQVKIRGFRIEVGEIEAALLAIDGVAAATVIAKRDSSEGARLIAYVVPLSGRALSASGAQSALGRKLPDYMMPGAIVVLDALPLNANGKIDKSSLPDPSAESLRQAAYASPETTLEMALANVWAEVLGLDRIGVLDNFFDVGGDSIRAIQLASRLRRLGHELTPRQVFHHPTVRALAEQLEAEQNSAVEAQAEVIAPFALAALEEEELERIRREHSDAEDIYPLTPLQEGMLLHSLARQGHGVYHLQERYHFNGDLNAEAFFEAWRRVVARHATLRTSFHLDAVGRPYQLVRSAVRLPCSYTDLSALSSEAQKQEIEEQLEESRMRGFDLAQAPLLRIHLIKLAPNLHLCVRDFHHIILDDWCTSPLMLEVREHYTAAVAQTPLIAEAAPQFRDYIAWLRRQDTKAAQAYWTRYLAGFNEPTPLVIAKTGETTAAATVDDVFAEISADDYSRLEALARTHRLTVNTFVQAAVGLLLCRYASAGEAVFGVTVAGRPAELPNCDAALGLFINGLPLRVRVSPDRPVLDWLKSLLADNVDMRQHEFVSQSMIQQCSDIPRANALLFQHLLTFENAPVDQRLLDDRSVFDISLAGLRVHTNYPITFVAIPGDKLDLRITYDQDRFDADDMRRMIRHWRLLICELARNIEGLIADLAPLDSDERKLTIVDWNQTVQDFGAPLDLVSRFEAQVELNGCAIAAACCGETLTFAALSERANRLAFGLIEQGFGENDIIAIFDDRGLDFLVSMLAIFKCGAGYLPIDPAYPDGRIASVLEEARVAAVLSGPAHLARAAELSPQSAFLTPRVLDRHAIEAASARTENSPRRHTPRSVAFVIYTSGSTGKPKGALVEHRGMFNNLITKVPALGLTSKDVIAQTASQCFDISVWQFLVGLAIGARVEILPDEISRDPERLVEAIQRCGITILESVPSMIRALIDAAPEKSLDDLRWLIPCGEAFTPELCRQVMARHPSLRLLNAYGPAECSDDVTYYPIIEAPPGNELSTPIGRPVDNCEIYVLDRWLDPAPIGAPGEICVAGIQVGRGYLHRPDLTAAAFRPNPFGRPGSTLYRTGDLGRWRADGVLDFLGRVDHQVKIRGHRIEPGEVEACLVTHPTVEEACVLPRDIGKGMYQLIAYVVGPEQEPSAMRAYLAQTLPDFMLPSFFVFLDKMPLSPNGKIDRRRLPDLDAATQHPGHVAAPRTPTEEVLCDIWKELLGVNKIGADSNFFELGGHSLLAIQLRSRIQSAFDVEIPLKNLFNTTTVESLALQIEELILADIDSMSEAHVETMNEQYVS